MGLGILTSMTFGGVTPMEFEGIKHVEMGKSEKVRNALIDAAKATGVVWSKPK